MQSLSQAKNPTGKKRFEHSEESSIYAQAEINTNA